jgi:UDP-N-acetylmuramoyl-tripeptide--D-alanyl-D-alanine ligase
MFSNLRWRLRAYRWRTEVFLLYLAARLWRRLLFRTRIIAITGSVGKTTTKELLASILSEQGRVVRTPGNSNSLKQGGLSSVILKIRPWDRFAVFEVGVEAPGEMWKAARLLRPDIVIVLRIARCHTNLFDSLEAIAEEKATLLKDLGPAGTAILNGDDALVTAMARNEQFDCRFFGTSTSFDVSASDVSSRWPERLRLTVRTRDESHVMQTLLVGTHWVTPILAALTASTCCGVPLARAVKCVEKVPPFWARMQPVRLNSGATIIRDEFNGSITTFEAAFKVLAEATAQRKIMVLSDYSDSPKKRRIRVNSLGRDAAKTVDMLVLVGENSRNGANVAIDAGMAPENAHAFFTINEATQFLRRELRDGDLVLLKGQSNHHLSRIYLGLLDDVSCQVPSCRKMILCDCCEQLGFSWRPELDGLMALPNAKL